MGLGAVGSHHLAYMFLLDCLDYLRGHSADTKGQGHLRTCYK
jgi:hypothetical protein